MPTKAQLEARLEIANEQLADEQDEHNGTREDLEESQAELTATLAELETVKEELAEKEGELVDALLGCREGKAREEALENELMKSNEDRDHYKEELDKAIDSRDCEQAMKRKVIAALKNRKAELKKSNEDRDHYKEALVKATKERNIYSIVSIVYKEALHSKQDALAEAQAKLKSHEAELNNREKAAALCAKFLSRFKGDLQKIKEGCGLAFKEVEEFAKLIALKAAYNDFDAMVFSPVTTNMDQLWHACVLDTKLYAEMNIFLLPTGGGFIHHNPHGADDSHAHAQRLEETVKMFKCIWGKAPKGPWIRPNGDGDYGGTYADDSDDSDDDGQRPAKCARTAAPPRELRWGGQIFVRGSGKTFTLDAGSSFTIEDVKRKIQEKEGFELFQPRSHNDTKPPVAKQISAVNKNHLGF